jgi:hypothetical protein
MAMNDTLGSVRALEGCWVYRQTPGAKGEAMNRHV